MAILLQENNVISLRSAFVEDDGNLAFFSLMPADLASLMRKGRTWRAPKDFDWVELDSTWLYRHMRSAADEAKLMVGFPCLDQDVKPILLEKPPEFRLLWTDSGNGVAVFLNGEPWAFIDEETHQGYSKGILRPAAAYLSAVGNLWDQKLFEKIFNP